MFRREYINELSSLSFRNKSEKKNEPSLAQKDKPS